MQTFSLDSHLDEDCLKICDLTLCRLLLLNDSRWPWLVLVPKVADVTEIHHLVSADQLTLLGEISVISQILAKITGCETLNVGALGNIVRQLHIHVIARNNGDPNWPGPVWGYGERQAYSAGASSEFITTIKEELP